MPHTFSGKTTESSNWASGVPISQDCEHSGFDVSGRLLSSGRPSATCMSLIICKHGKSNCVYRNASISCNYN